MKLLAKGPVTMALPGTVNATTDVITGVGSTTQSQLLSSRFENIHADAISEALKRSEAEAAEAQVPCELEFVAETSLPTALGTFRMRAYRDVKTGEEPMALLVGQASTDS